MVKLRNESPADADAVANVVRAAFGREDEVHLVQALHRTGNTVVAVIGEIDGEVIAHCLLSKLSTPKDCLALAPVSIMPEHQNQGVGKRIIGKVLRQAQASGWAGVFVLGEPAYYERFGFSANLAAPFIVPFPKNHFLAKELKPDALKGRSGPVQYAKPFREIS